MVPRGVLLLLFELTDLFNLFKAFGELQEKSLGFSVGRFFVLQLNASFLAYDTDSKNFTHVSTTNNNQQKIGSCFVPLTPTDNQTDFEVVQLGGYATGSKAGKILPEKCQLIQCRLQCNSYERTAV